MRINVLHLLETFNVEGYGTVVFNLVQGSDRDIFQNFVCCLQNGGEQEAAFKTLGVKTTNFDLKMLLDLSVIFKMVGFIKEWNIQLVHTHVTRADVFGRVAARLAKVPWVFSSIHGLDEHREQKRKRLHSMIDRFSMTLATRIIAVSEAVKTHVVHRQHIRPSRITTIYNGVDPGRYDIHIDVPAKKGELGLRKDCLTIGVCGRLVAVKGYDVFLKAARNVLRHRHRIQFLIVGEGVLRNELETLAQDLEIDAHVVFSGFRADIPEVLAIMDIYVMPSLNEGLPMNLLEAMAAAKPVIATHVGGIPEVLDKKGIGIMIPPNDCDMLADSILMLLENQEMRYEMGRKGRARVIERFHVEDMVEAYERLYLSHIRKGKGLMLNRELS